MTPDRKIELIKANLDYLIDDDSMPEEELSAAISEVESHITAKAVAAMERRAKKAKAEE